MGRIFWIVFILSLILNLILFFSDLMKYKEPMLGQDYSRGYFQAMSDMDQEDPAVIKYLDPPFNIDI